MDRVGFIRAVYDAYNARDADRFVELVRHLGPGFAWHPNPADPDQRGGGLDELVAQLAELWEAFDRFESRVVDIAERPLGVLVVVEHRARGRGSGAIVERTEAHVWTFDRGLTTGLAEFETREQGLEYLRAATWDLLRRGYDALSRGGREALAELLAADVEVRLPVGGRVEGVGPVVAFAAPEAFDWQTVEPEREFLEGDDRVFVPVVVRARGRGSEVEVEQRFFHVLRLREGLLTSLTIHERRDAALLDFGAG